MTKKILIASISGGSGHMRAGQALQKTAAQLYPDLEIDHIDMFDYVAPPTKQAIVGSYNLMVRHIADLWKFLYKKTDSSKPAKFAHKLFRQIHKMNAKKFYDYVENFDPDYILCTHFLSSYALLEPPEQRKIKAPVSLLTTDYDNHTMQFTPGIHTYFVPTKKMVWKFKKAEAKNVILSGIPVDPIFYEEKKITELKKTYNIDPQKKVILVLSGGWGCNKIDELIEDLFEIETPIHIIAIAGNNQKLKKRLDELENPNHISRTNLGWTNKIDECMRMADVVISKSGGLTTSECMTLGKPLISMRPVPGQEEANTEFLLKNGFGDVAHNKEDLLYYIEKFSQSEISDWRKIYDKPPAQTILENIV